MYIYAYIRQPKISLLITSIKVFITLLAERV